jgi:hypothetical protein
MHEATTLWMSCVLCRSAARIARASRSRGLGNGRGKRHEGWECACSSSFLYFAVQTENATGCWLHKTTKCPVRVRVCFLPLEPGVLPVCTSLEIRCLADLQCWKPGSAPITAVPTYDSRCSSGGSTSYPRPNHG